MNSIRRRLTRDVLIVSALLLGGSLAALYFAARAELVEQFDAALQARAQALGPLTGHEDGRIHFDLADFRSGRHGEESPDVFVEFWSADGAVLARSPSLGASDLPRRAGPLVRPRYWNLWLPDGRPGRAIAVTFQPRPEAGAPGRGSSPVEVQLVVAGDRENLDEALTELLGIGGACGVLLLGATLWTVPRVLRRGLAPLDRLGEQAGQIDADKLAVRFPAAGLPVELQPICARLNALLARLEESFARERRFSADLAHELRTPLAELRSLAECALMWPESREASTDRDTLAVARQMEALVGNMLALARAEHGHLAVRREPVAVETLVRDAWRPFAARAEARDLRADLAPPEATAAADPVLLRSILSNLFDNAVHYAPAGGTIRITGETGPAGVTVRVANATDNLEPADMEKLFDRFWRKEAARSGGEHTGLGLPLARMFAGAMEWTLTAALEDGSSLVFTLRGPATA
jgi:two-component system sensor histidine kinase QseC